MKPQLLLHICCAPDEAWVIHTLHNEYNLHCFFSNPNIDTQSEYDKRLKEAQKAADLYKIPFDFAPYIPDLWENAVANLVHTKEGEERCLQCFLLRLRQTAAFCKSLGWQHFTSVMSVSPHKNITMLNLAGETTANEFGLSYKPFNFKKNNGFLNSIKLSNELGLYRQDYCGCRLSKVESEERKRKKATTTTGIPINQK